MASFDVTDLYTNVPLIETINICLKLLNDGTNNILGLPLKDFRTMLELSVFNSVFLFNGKFYKQTDGLVMGLPLSPTLANIFLCYWEKIWLNQCPNHFKPAYFRRYVDDCFILFHHESHAELFLQYLNSKHDNIKFTCETENNKKLAFLDCLIDRTNNGFTSSVYRKPTFTGQGLSFFSFSPLIYKINSIRTLIFRAYNICSNMTSLSKEFSFLVRYFNANGFPKCLIYSHIQKFINKLQNQRPVVQTVNRKDMYLSLPYLGPTSDKLKLDLEKITLKYFPFIKLHVVFVNLCTLTSLFKYKDVLPSSMRSSIIYKYCVR